MFIIWFFIEDRSTGFGLNFNISGFWWERENIKVYWLLNIFDWLFFIVNYQSTHILKVKYIWRICGWDVGFHILCIWTKIKKSGAIWWLRSRDSIIIKPKEVNIIVIGNCLILLRMGIKEINLWSRDVRLWFNLTSDSFRCMNNIIRVSLCDSTWSSYIKLIK